MNITIGGTSNSTYGNLSIRNSQTNVQGTDNQGKKQGVQQGVQSENNTQVATKYVSSHGDTVEISKAGAKALQQSTNSNTSKASSTSNNNTSSSVVSPGTLSVPQLKQAYVSGKISKAQYDQQMKLRGQAE
ncbi:protein involved in polysaccharide export with SLBB domain [Clostridium algifaecis]|uniref:Protein involved in polysaccharide export with SLBB domain n=1 Tax=Clostridium algifaecis TaxID=1472040 RepID=A0ABS4KS06_9CLOT|nr:hypothetical protein [Clostridium algifaecis]MBP2032818.1 protein involved in polysaccharide export with SLBB domain [Clostridium algifaecis]